MPSQRDIGFASAAGQQREFGGGICRRGDVGDGAIAAGFDLRDKTLGVVGVGNVGSRVVRYAETLGMRVLQNDPPRQRAEDVYPARERGYRLCPSIAFLREADIITIHVPLTKSGPDATFHMFDAKRLTAFTPPGGVGAAADPHQLRARRGRGQQGATGNHRGKETGRRRTRRLGRRAEYLARFARRRGPRLAAHRGLQLRRQSQRHADDLSRRVRVFRDQTDMGADIATATRAVLRSDGIGAGEDDEDVLRRVIRQIYDITADDAALRRIMRAPIRSEQPRSESGQTSINCVPSIPSGASSSTRS